MGFVSSSNRVVIGSSPSANLHLTDRTVSRFHCELSLVDGRVLLRDLGSRNGTRVNGVSVLQACLDTSAVLAMGNTRLRFELGEEGVQIPLSADTSFGAMVGCSTAMRAVFALLDRAALSEATVLLEGETGTGKEAAAESVHGRSARRDGPFIVVDCGSIPRELIESELFGHERGAFTGAHERRVGAFEAASTGTLFLDEIGELPLDLQPKLLRVLEKREVKRVGSNQRIPVDVRLIAATHRNLPMEVNAHRFRSDLDYRLAVLEVRLPPLRDRLEDLPLLVERLLSIVGVADRPEAEMLRTERFLRDLASHSWPGNVRELRNYLEKCLTLRMSAPLPSEETPNAPPRIDTRQSLRVAREAWTLHWERRYLEQLLREHEDNVSAAAKAAEVDRAHFYRLLWKHGLR